MSVVAVYGDDQDLLNSACAAMRTASGYHVDATSSDKNNKTPISGDIAGDDYDLTVNSNNRVCKVKEKFWTSQDGGQHWQEGAPDDEIFLFVKSILKGNSRMADGGIIDKSRYVSLQRTVTGDKTVTCVEVWLGPLPNPLQNPLPDNEDMPHYWIAETKNGDTWIEHVKSKASLRSAIVSIDATFTKFNEISIITPPSSGTARAPYVVTVPSPGVIVVTVPGDKVVTPPAPETASQIQVGSLQQSVRENSLGMKFVPAGTPKILFSIWDVRVKDFRVFVDATGYKARNGHGTTPDFAQTDNDPVVLVDWKDAKAFCDWLTKKEHEDGKLGSDEYYRLPTDTEWSTAVGLNENNHDFPSDKCDLIKGVYPWGTQWPPPSGAGNYDESLTHDSYIHTSPVGSFPANLYGLYDMGGNVQQWCEDVYGSDDVGACYRTSRGGSCNANTADWCLSSDRGNGNAGLTETCGFRVVLANHSDISLPEYAETIDRNLKGLFNLIWQSQLGDAAEWASEFAPTSHYCYKDNGPASREYIQNDREKLTKAWPDRDYTLIGEPVYIVSPEKTSARITFSYSYVYKREPKEASGISNTALNVEMSSNGEWLITQYEETAKRR
jgi:hypothetical protein